MFKTSSYYALLLILFGLLISACSTKNLIERTNQTQTNTIRVQLIEDQVLAFGRLAKTYDNLPTDTLVIAGKHYSYLLTKGGSQFLQLMSALDPQHIQIRNDLSFYTPKNDGRFHGKLSFTYVHLQENIGRHDVDFFIQHGAQECSTQSDQRINAQRFCFELDLAGRVYPRAKHIANLQPLSKAYEVSIYTTKVEIAKHHRAISSLESMMLFPLAVAIDIVALPFWAVDRVID